MLNQHAYALNAANQRTKQTFSEGYVYVASAWWSEFKYDAFGRPESGRNTGAYWASAIGC